MILYLNRENVIVDIVEAAKPVRRSRAGLTVLCSTGQAEGYIGSDNETIYARMGQNLIPAYTDVARMIQADVPVGIKPLAWKYEDGEFLPNEKPYPLDNVSLTDNTAQNAADLEYVAMMAGIDL